MTARHAVLVFAAVATLGLGVYLFHAVNVTPSAGAETTHVQTHDEPKAVAAKGSDPEPSKSPPPMLNGHPVAPSTKSVPSTPTPSLPPEKPDGPTTDVKKDNMMAEANKAYDAGELDDAMSLARKVLDDDPTNTRMRRIMVSAACILGDTTTAQKHYLLLPPPDRETMRIRCARYGVTFTES